MGKSRKLFWLEYTDSGNLLIVQPFQIVGFEIKDAGWTPEEPGLLLKHAFPEIEAWVPDVIVFWLAGRRRDQFIQEPPELLKICQLIRTHSGLRNTKLMAFLRLHQSTPEQETVWRQRYDFYTRWPIRVIEHAKAAMRLVGGETDDIVGVNYYLKRNGNWKIHYDHPIIEKNNLLPDAEGRFEKTPLARLLIADKENKYTWLKGGLQADVLTSIVYIIKDLQGWQRGLNSSDMERLIAVANKTISGRQLLLGVNELLLETGPELIALVIDQARQVGNWKVFINEHLWFANFPVSNFENILYEGRFDPLKAIIVP